MDTGEAMGTSDTRPITDWLIDGARSAALPQQVLAELCDRLAGAGVPLWQAEVFVRTLHPQLLGRRFVWRAGGGVAVLEAPHDLFDDADFRNGAIARVCASGARVRRRLGEATCPMDFPELQGLRAAGVTDHLVSPLVFTDGAVHAAAWTTRDPAGFTAAALDGIEAVVRPLARVAEVRALARTASNLLDTYVGHRTGERILAGHIRRGDSESIDAAIWLSDMRDFTALSDRLPPQQLIDTLNRYFDCQIPPILAQGGEVLKFIGDGLLAIFPIAGDQVDVSRLCHGVLAAARAACANLASLRDVPGRAGEPLQLGLALHVGRVLYGNIGGGNRLDFTCIGPAVNLAARIEKQCRVLGRSVLGSAAFARYCEAQMTALGDFALPGIASPERIYGLIDAAATD